MKLSQIFNTNITIDIKNLCIDSRKCTKGTMFFCMDGLNYDGHAFIEQAIESGATCIVHSKHIEEYDESVVYIKVDDVVDVLNQVVKKFYKNPTEDMLVFGVTGTNGKTTITNIIYDLLNHYSTCGYIGTIGIKYKDQTFEPSLTTPDAITLHHYIKKMKDANVKALALEVSSHGLELRRGNAIDFDVAIFSNFTHDHIDFHGSLEAYFNAKTKLFKTLKKEGIAILNADDEKYEQLRSICNAETVSYGIENEADYRADNIKLYPKKTCFTLIHNEKSYDVCTNLSALYNVYNLLAAIAALVETGADLESLLTHINHIEQVEGRLEIIDEGQPFNVVVDFAHTPDGLEKIFEYAKEITPQDGEIITVFGSAGKRDRSKRKTFGEIADKYCDYIILTEDDPRTENAKDIANEIKEGIKETRTIFIENRYNAIRLAIESANVNDSVFILGKGNEVFMYTADGKTPWQGDHVAAKEIIHKYYFSDEN